MGRILLSTERGAENQQEITAIPVQLRGRGLFPNPAGSTSGFLNQTGSPQRHVHISTGRTTTRRWLILYQSQAPPRPSE